jgi:hypothetical protein
MSSRIDSLSNTRRLAGDERHGARLVHRSGRPIEMISVGEVRDALATIIRSTRERTRRGVRLSE